MPTGRGVGAVRRSRRSSHLMSASAISPAQSPTPDCGRTGGQPRMDALRERPLPGTGLRRHPGRRAVQARDDVGRRAGFGRRRHLGPHRMRCVVAAGARGLPASMALQRRRHGLDHDVDPAVDGVGHGRPVALVRHVQHADAGLAAQDLGRRAVRRAGIRRGTVRLVRIGLRIGRQLGRHRRRHGRIRHHQRHLSGHHDRREVVEQVVAQGALPERGPGRVRGQRAHRRRVAVGRGLGERLGTDVATGAGAAVDPHLLAERLAQAGWRRCGRSRRRRRPADSARRA